MKKIAVMVAVIAVASVFAQGPKPAKHTYTAEQARAIALKEYKGKVVGKVVLENENGKWQYAVMIQDGKKIREVMVGADSGKIEHVEITTLQKERAEQAAERKRELKGERERESERARGFRTRARQVGRTKIPHTWGPPRYHYERGPVILGRPVRSTGMTLACSWRSWDGGFEDVAELRGRKLHDGVYDRTPGVRAAAAAWKCARNPLTLNCGSGFKLFQR